MKPLVRCLFYLSSVCIMSTCIAGAQQSREEPRFPIGTIDGSVTPDQIPDIVAFRLFLSAVAGKPTFQSENESTAAPSLSAKQEAKLAPLQLNDADKRILSGILADFKNNLLTVTRAPSVSSPSSSGSEAPRPDLDAIAQQSVDALRNNMSREGFRRLQAYVQAEKRHMKIIPLPQMSEHSTGQHSAHVK